MDVKVYDEKRNSEQNDFCHSYRRSLSRIGNICLLTCKAHKLLELVLRSNKICIQSKI
jgi:hypothetical protein